MVDDILCSFSLRSLLLSQILIVAPLAWVGMRLHMAQQEQITIDTIQRLGGGCDRISRHSINAVNVVIDSISTVTESVGLGTIKTVSSVGCDGPTFTNAEFARIKEFQDLRFVFSACSSITDSALEDADLLSHLDLLALPGTAITDVGAEHIAKIHGLEDLDLADTGVTDAGLMYITELANLRSLDLSGTGTTDHGVRQLISLKHIRHLGLRNTRVTDAGLLYIEQMKSLESLSLADTDISDEGLLILTQLPMISDLDITNTKSTDNAIAHLRRMPALRRLFIEGTRISKEAADALEKEKPLIVIYR